MTKKTLRVILLIPAERLNGRDLLKGISKYARIHGNWILYREPPYYRLPDVNERIRRFKKWKPDGIIMCETLDVEEILKIGVPTIISPFRKKQFANTVSIVPDNFRVGQVAAEHFLSRGFQNFAYCGFNDMFHHIERGQAFEETIKKAGFKTRFLREKRALEKVPWEEQQDFLAEWIKYLPKPMALMAGNGEIAQNVIEACRISNVCIPDEVAIISTDNDDTTLGLSWPPISSVVYDTEKAGYEAAEFLEEMITGKKVTQEFIIIEPTHIQTRLSTDTIAVENQNLADAINFIRKNSQNPVRVSDILDELLISKTELNRLFKKHLKRTVQDEIARVRTNEIVKLLLNTDLSISQIALKLGFPDDKHISRYFQRIMGTSPQKYREQHKILNKNY